jgi:hypothetical protein
MQAFTRLLSTLGCFSSNAGESTKPHPKADPSARPKWNDGNPKFEISEKRRRNNDKNDAVALGIGYGNMGSTGWAGSIWDSKESSLWYEGFGMRDEVRPFGKIFTMIIKGLALYKDFFGSWRYNLPVRRGNIHECRINKNL